MLHINFEHTDTYGGESNYSWVKRETITLHPSKNLSDLAIVRRAKAWAGFTGLRCRVEKYGDMIAIYPRGLCQVVFVTM